MYEAIGCRQRQYHDVGDALLRTSKGGGRLAKDGMSKWGEAAGQTITNIPANLFTQPPNSK